LAERNTSGKVSKALSASFKSEALAGPARHMGLAQGVPQAARGSPAASPAATTGRGSRPPPPPAARRPSAATHLPANLPPNVRRAPARAAAPAPTPLLFSGSDFYSSSTGNGLHQQPVGDDLDDGILDNLSDADDDDDAEEYSA